MKPTNETTSARAAAEAAEPLGEGTFRSSWHAMGDPDADAMVAKADLVRQLRAAIQEAGLTQTQAAERVGMAQSHLSRLLSGRFRSVTFDQLFGLLVAMGRSVRVVVGPAHELPLGVAVAGPVDVYAPLTEVAAVTAAEAAEALGELFQENKRAISHMLDQAVRQGALEGDIVELPARPSRPAEARPGQPAS